MRRRPAFLAAVVALAALFCLACGTGCNGEDGPPSSQIFVAPPWSGEERLTYELTDQGDNVIGTCIAETLPNDDGTTTLNFNCSGDGDNSDNRTSIVDSETLRPIETTRVIDNRDNDTVTELNNIYGEDVVVLERVVDNDRTNEIERDLPDADEDEPEPGVYDDNDLFWLMRGLDFARNYDAAFHDVNAIALVQIVDVRVRIDGTETIETPTGTYETWRMRLDSETSSSRFWVAMDDPHYIVQARLETTTFTLVDIE